MSHGNSIRVEGAFPTVMACDGRELRDACPTEDVPLSAWAAPHESAMLFSLIRRLTIDLSGLRLSAEEGFVFSRLDRPLSVRDVVDQCGLEQQRVLQIVRRLYVLGAVDLSPESLADIGYVPDESAVTIEFAATKEAGRGHETDEDQVAICDLSTGQNIGVTPCFRAVVGRGGMLFLVSAGVGGGAAAATASATLVQAILDYLALHPIDGGHCASALAQAVQHAHQQVAAAAASDAALSRMGASFIAFLLHGDVAYTAEVGDARAYVLRAGALSRISKDQTQLQILIDQGLMDEEQARASHARSVVLQTIGQAPELVIGQHELPMREGDKFILCSGALSGRVEDADLHAALSWPLDEGSALLLRAAKDVDDGANASFIVGEVIEADSPPSEEDDVPESVRTIRAFSVG
jgi:serine/threonine protein phosphatase PrpC